MADAQGRRVGQELEVSDFDELALLQFAAEIGTIICDHPEDGWNVTLINPISNRIRTLLKSDRSFPVK